MPLVICSKVLPFVLIPPPRVGFHMLQKVSQKVHDGVPVGNIGMPMNEVGSKLLDDTRPGKTKQASKQTRLVEEVESELG